MQGQQRLWLPLGESHVTENFYCFFSLIVTKQISCYFLFLYHEAEGLFVGDRIQPSSRAGIISLGFCAFWTGPCAHQQQGYSHNCFLCVCALSDTASCPRSLISSQCVSWVALKHMHICVCDWATWAKNKICNIYIPTSPIINYGCSRINLGSYKLVSHISPKVLECPAHPLSAAPEVSRKALHPLIPQILLSGPDYYKDFIILLCDSEM